jgi:hypothetical protein
VGDGCTPFIACSLGAGGDRRVSFADQVEQQLPWPLAIVWPALSGGCECARDLVGLGDGVSWPRGRHERSVAPNLKVLHPVLRPAAVGSEDEGGELGEGRGRFGDAAFEGMARDNPNGTVAPNADVRTATIGLPPGFIGNPQAVRQCCGLPVRTASRISGRSTPSCPGRMRKAGQDIRLKVSYVPTGAKKAVVAYSTAPKKARKAVA